MLAGVYTALKPATPLIFARGSKRLILSVAIPGVQSATPRGPNETRVMRRRHHFSPRPDWMVFFNSRQLLPRYVLHLE